MCPIRHIFLLSFLILLLQYPLTVTGVGKDNENSSGIVTTLIHLTKYELTESSPTYNTTYGTPRKYLGKGKELVFM